MMPTCRLIGSLRSGRLWKAAILVVILVPCFTNFRVLATDSADQP